MTEIDRIIAQLEAIIVDLRRLRNPQNDMLIYLSEMALAEARDVKVGVRRKLPQPE